ncbi:DNA-binding response regulator [Pedobacter yulinensis]|uniref:DNA-binding response regulator n=1 Tax=Pedobacter yulinensis TaxID=2126353 RepID=A0A2T3HNW9_9SPHI|nr:LytTR family DNA-binding domain-containing protein [Pedobacter yulinensis]PST84150.1 DNA-binding response regulator [Pedobacter yulinensis]
MNILIIEDEELAAAQLADMLQEVAPQAVIAATPESIEDAVAFLTAGPPIDLILLDIYLSDGLSFEIFDAVKVDTPVIFTTAYNEYAIRAFELNSIGYLLKPVKKEHLQRAIDKCMRLRPAPAGEVDVLALKRVTDMLMQEKTYRRSFLVPYRDRLIPVATESLAWFASTGGIVTGTQFTGQQVTMEEKSLEELSDRLDPDQFFRVNRQYLVSRKAIKHLSFFFNGRLSVELNPPAPERVLISKAKAASFRQWMQV